MTTSDKSPDVTAPSTTVGQVTGDTHPLGGVTHVTAPRDKRSKANGSKKPQPKPKRLSPAEAKELAELEAFSVELDARPEAPASVKERNAKAAARLLERRKTRRSMPRMKVGLVAGALHMGSGYKDDDVGFAARLAELLGATDTPFVNMLQNQLLNATAPAQDDKSLQAAVVESLAFVAGIAPENELEAVLAAQMYAVHCATMKLSRLMNSADGLNQFQTHGSLLVKTSRTFAAQVEALSKLRSAGKQTVEVIHVHKHVYVAPGGQAIVGDVHHGGGGGGPPKSGEQPHASAQLTDETGAGLAPMWGADPIGNAVQRAGSERAVTVPDARGNQPRRADGTGKRQLARRPVDEGGDRDEIPHPRAGEGGQGDA